MEIRKSKIKGLIGLVFGKVKDVYEEEAMAGVSGACVIRALVMKHKTSALPAPV